jgi:hypothetical protein
MGQMAFCAFAGVVSLDRDLFEPCWPGRILFVAADAVDAREPAGNGVRAAVYARRRLYVGAHDVILDETGFNVWVVGVVFAHAMAGFAGKGFMRPLGQLWKNFRMAFLARFAARVDGCSRGDFLQRIAAIPPIFMK